jgi:hypothetical protein
LAIGAVLIGLAGCSGGDEDKAANKGGESPSPAAAPLVTYAGPAGDAQNYVKVLRGLDADLVDDEPLAISNGVRACEELGQGKSMAEVAQATANRFEVDAGTAQQIVVITKSNLCK